MTLADYEKLCDDIVAGRVEVAVNVYRLNRPGSPVFSRTDNSIPGLVAIAASLTAMYSLGMIAGFGVLGAYFVLWYRIFLPRNRLRVHDRAVRLVLASPHGLNQLWADGSIQLRRGEEACTSPRDDWVAFARGEPWTRD